MHVEIWHNPACGTSRNALALIREAGLEPVIVDYLHAPPDKQRLQQAIRQAGLCVRDAIRSKQPEFLAQGLDDPALSDEQLLDAMLATPFDAGMIARRLQAGEDLLGSEVAKLAAVDGDTTGLASGALLYRFKLAPGESREAAWLTPLEGGIAYDHVDTAGFDE